MFWTKHKRQDQNERRLPRKSSRIASVEANGFGTWDNNGSGHGSQRYLPIYDDLAKGTIVEQWLPKDPRKIHRIFRNIYARDSICGPAIDFYRELPWSPFSLTGVEDKVRQTYEDSFEALEILQWLPEAAAEYLILGKICVHLLMDEQKGIWTDGIIHDPDYLQITPIPTIKSAPKVDLTPTPEWRAFMKSTDSRDIEAKELMQQAGMLPPELQSLILAGKKIPLDPAQTIYLPRKGSPYDWEGSSIYLRILTFLSLEYSLINASISAARRKAGGILHVKSGSEEWDPELSDLDEIRDLFMEAEEDPVGTVISTRQDVEAGYVGGAGEVWKISDEWEFLSEAKMWGLGISSSFLSGEATYNCLTGDALIPTEQGLLRIDEIADPAKGDQQDIDLIVGSRYGNEKAVKWLNNGKAPTICITTDYGHSITGTPKHPLLVLRDYTLDWLPLSEIHIGDIVCSPMGRKTVRTEPLALNLTWLTQGRGGALRSDLKKPDFMTPELAVVLAGITADGSAGAKGNETKIAFYSSDPLMIDQYVTCFEKSFGIRPEINKLSQNHWAKKPPFAAVVSSKQIVEWLHTLDLYLGTRDDTEGFDPSYFKRLGKAIRQADEKSQLAYLGMYLACDGSTKGDWCIQYFSTSDQLLMELQALLSMHGHFSAKDGMCLSLDSNESWALWQKIAPWVPCKHKKIDQGKEVNVQGWYKDAPQTESILQDHYTEGEYTQFLENLKLISPSFHTQLVQLLKLNYRFIQIVNIEDKGEQEVYDISMEPGVEPAFIANGLIVHNTMETQMSVFMERLRAFRDHFTQKLLLQKIVAPLAINHGFIKRTPAQLAHRIRIAKPITDYSQLLIPTVVWQKPLKPHGDENYLDILQRLEDKGIPITLRTWASAGGFDLDTELEQIPADKLLRAKVMREAGDTEDLEEEFGLEEGLSQEFSQPFDESSGEESSTEPESSSPEETSEPETPTSPGETELPGASFDPRNLRKGEFPIKDFLLTQLENLPLWKEEAFLDISKREACDLLQTILRKGQDKRAMNVQLKESTKTWTPPRKEVFFYLLSRIGILKNSALSDLTRRRIIDWIGTIGKQARVKEYLYFSRISPDKEADELAQNERSYPKIIGAVAPDAKLLSGF